MFFLQILLILILVLAIGMTTVMRQWIATRSRSDKWMGGTLLVLIIGGHLLGQGHRTFPLVNWSMYSKVDEAPEFNTVEMVAFHPDGSETTINPIEAFPSLVHCFTPRFVRLVEAADQNKLTPNGRQVYCDLMESIRSRYRRSLPGDSNRIEKVHVYLVTIRKSDHERVSQKLVSQHSNHDKWILTYPFLNQEPDGDWGEK